MAFWADKIADKIEEQYKGKIAKGEELVLRDEKTMSGRVHVGSLRSLSLHALISDVLTERGVKNKFFYEINDFDPMDGLPIYLDKNEYEQHMGKPLYTIPAPDKKAKNFAEYFASEYTQVVDTIANPEYYRASELYLSGKMNEVIRTALEHADLIRKIYFDVSKSKKDDDWFPFNVICEQCGKFSTTKVADFDGEHVTYTCEPAMVNWAKGCGNGGTMSPFDGNGKLPWKVEWAAKFKVMNVDIEGAGKDHYTKGGSRHVANRICEEVFNFPHPFDTPHEFILVGGKKMSSSKGEGTSAVAVARLLPAHLLRFYLVYKDINRQINFDPEGDTIPVLFDTYDKFADKYFNKIGDDEARVFFMAHFEGERKNLQQHFLPRFSQIAFMVQMPHLNIEDEVRALKGEALTEGDQKVLEERMFYASAWLTKYAPEEYKYELKIDSVPPQALQFTVVQKKALKKVLSYIQTRDKLDGQELHTKLHEIRKEEGLEPKDFFAALYVSFLGKESGPKAGWFLSVLDKKFLIKRLQEAST